MANLILQHLQIYLEGVAERGTPPRRAEARALLAKLKAPARKPRKSKK